VDVILLDEAHLLGPGSSTMLARIRAALGDPPLVGVTATGFRTDSASLIDAGIFETVVHETTIGGALAAGLLCPLVTKAPRQGRIDLSNVPIVAGEFHAGALEAAAMAGDVTAQAVARTVEVARSEQRRSWLIFASGVAHAHQTGDELDRYGVTHAVITGETPIEARSEAIARFREGSLTALTNCNVLTTGFDATGIDLVAFMWATCSPVLWVQSAGRGMRIHPGKTDCRMLDFGANIFRHGPIDNVVLRKAGERHDTDRAAARTRICPHCDEVNAASATTCSVCGLSLVKVRDTKLDMVESTLEVIGGTKPATGNWTRVLGMQGHIHHKPGAPVKSRAEADSETVRERVWEWWKADLQTRLKPRAKIVLVMTRWHEDDLGGRLLAEMDAGGRKWEVLRLPMEAEAGDQLGRAPGDPLWPEWFTDDMRADAKRDVRTWSALYQQRPAPDTGTYFSRESLRPANSIPRREDMRIYGGSDYAVTANDGDWTVHIVVGVDPDSRLWLLDLWRGQTASDAGVEAFCDLVRQ
jgi:hypothetical protein